MTTTCFAALVVTEKNFASSGAHVTIGVNKDATPDEVALMRQELDEIVNATLPFDLIVVDNKARVGVNVARKRDAILCEAEDPVVGAILKSYYKRHSKRVHHGCPLAFPELVMHVTLSTHVVVDIPVGTRITVKETLFESRNDAADASTEYTDKDWTCLRCSTINPIAARQCTGRRMGVQCLQWRPKALISRAHRKREGDWQCCGEEQYATRTTCRRCGRNNNNNSVNKKRSICK